MTTLGQAYVQIMPSAQGISGSIQKTIKPEATAAGKSAGRNIASSMASSMSKVGSTLTKGITVPALGAATAVGGIVSALGFGRLSSVDSAQAQLRGLGYEAEDVERITDQLSTALEGGMMDMGQATSAAATAMAAGVQEGSELTKYIQTLDAAAAGSTASVGEMAQIFGRVTDQGKLSRNEFDMIAQRMPGFSAAVQEHMGVGSEAMYEMLRNGEITADEFINIMDGFAGDMATEYAKSWSGMWQNTKTYIGMIGESLLGGVFEQSKESIAEFIEFLSSDKVVAWATETGQVIGDAFSRVVEAVSSAIQWWTNLDGSTQRMIMTIGGIAVAIGPVLMIAGKLITTVMQVHGWFGKLRLAIAPLIAAISSITAPVWVVVGAIAGLIALFVTLYNRNEAFRELVQTVWGAIKETISTVIQAVSSFVREIFGSLVAWWNENNQLIRQTIQVVWQAVQQIIMGVLNALMPFIKAAWSVIQTVTTTVWNVIKTVIQTVINAVMGIIKAVMQAITGDWSGAWETIRGVVDTVINGIRNIVSTVMGAISNIISTIMGTIRSVISSIWGAIRNIISSVLGGIRNTVSSIWNGIRNVMSSVLNGIRNTVSSIWSGIRNIISRIVNSIKNTVSNIFNSLRGVVSSAFGRVRSAVSNGMTRAFNTVNNFFGRFKTAGRNIVTSIADGIRGAISSVTDAIGNVTGKIRDFLPFSPPKDGPLTDIMDVEWGKTIGGGIEKGEGAVAKAMEDVLNFDLTKKANFSGANADKGKTQGNVYHFAPGSVVLDVSKMKKVGDVVELMEGLRQAVRKW